MDTTGSTTDSRTAPTDTADPLARFQRDISDHKVTVLRDDGLYRHLLCSDGTFNMQFDVLTWPGHLCFTGDMGSYVFARIEDMFEFFRGRLKPMIDLGYLAQKAVAADKTDGIHGYNEEMFRAAVKEWADEFAAELVDRNERAEFIEAVDDEVLSLANEGRTSAVEAAETFRWDGEQVFADFWEVRVEDYTGRFRWCCYAIPWAIAQYDELRERSAPVAPSDLDEIIADLREALATPRAKLGLPCATCGNDPRNEARLNRAVLSLLLQRLKKVAAPVAAPPAERSERTQHWSVAVDRDGENIVTLESQCQSGRDLSPEDGRVIRMAAEHLRAFIGADPLSVSGTTPDLTIRQKVHVLIGETRRCISDGLLIKAARKLDAIDDLLKAASASSPAPSESKT